LSVNDFKRMNNESYIRITLSNLAALLARANMLVQSYNKARGVLRGRFSRSPVVVITLGKGDCTRTEPHTLRPPAGDAPIVWHRRCRLGTGAEGKDDVR
jgi:hypothetical protein